MWRLAWHSVPPPRTYSNRSENFGLTGEVIAAFERGQYVALVPRLRDDEEKKVKRHLAAWAASASRPMTEIESSLQFHNREKRRRS
jgi:hypothetical protein